MCLYCALGEILIAQVSYTYSIFTRKMTQIKYNIVQKERKMRIFKLIILAILNIQLIKSCLFQILTCNFNFFQ